MKKLLIQTAGCSPSSGYVRAHLEAQGISVTDTPSTEVTHLLLDVPSFEAGGKLRGGGDLKMLLHGLPENVSICGGGLDLGLLKEYNTVDLLKDPDYLANNAYITAEAALNIALPRLPCLLRDSKALILGWGRIGKCLAQLLKSMDATVIVAARNGHDRSILRALGYDAVDIPDLENILPNCRIVFNTVPQMLLPESSIKLCRGDCVKIDLASQPGMAGPGVIVARGLPGLHKPESSGKLIVQTLLRLIGKEITP